MRRPFGPMWRGVVRDLGLVRAPGLWRDGLWWLAVSAAVPAWFVLTRMAPPRAVEPLGLTTLLLMVGWQPLIEELLFRGALQGRLLATTWGGRRRGGVSIANVLTSSLFALAHLAYHPPLWALATFIPSLAFGSLRERHASVGPAVLLHGWYNAVYLLAQAAARTGL